MNCISQCTCTRVACFGARLARAVHGGHACPQPDAWEGQAGGMLGVGRGLWCKRSWWLALGQVYEGRHQDNPPKP